MFLRFDEKIFASQQQLYTNEFILSLSHSHLCIAEVLKDMNEVCADDIIILTSLYIHCTHCLMLIQNPAAALTAFLSKYFRKSNLAAQHFNQAALARICLHIY